MIDATATLRGLTIGAGTPFTITAFPDVLSTPDVDNEDVRLPRRDGVQAGHDHKGGRYLSFELAFDGATPAAVEMLAQTLADAFNPGPDDEVLTVRLSGSPGEYAFIGRPRGVAFGWPTFRSGVMTARASFLATDPARYGLLSEVVVGLAAHPLPQMMPFILGHHDSATFTNSGRTSRRWTVDIEAIGGPVIDPSIAHTTSGQIVFHDTAMAEGDVLTLDGYEQRATLNGEMVIPSRAQWWAVVPDVNTVRFTAGRESSLASTATLSWRAVFG